MKVVIEVPKSVLKKATFLLLSQSNGEEVEQQINKAAELCEQSDYTEIPVDLFEEQKDEVLLTFAIGALTSRLREV